MPSLPISVLIPTMNRPLALERTLRTYLEADCLPAQIVIVDQTTDKEMRARISELAQSTSETEITYVFQDMPSTTLSRNKAIDLATQDILIFSDDDVDVANDTLRSVYDLMENGNIAMVAGMSGNEGAKSSSGYLFGTKSFRKRHIGHVTRSMLGRFPQQAVVGEVDTEWAMGFFFAVRKSLLEKWGICWDENLTGYAYGEDLDFSHRYYKKAKENGLRCILSDRVQVLHRVSSEYRTPSRKATFLYVVNRLYFSHKLHMGPGSRLWMKWTNFSMSMLRMLRKENTKDMRDARRFARAHRALIKAGNMHELYGLMQKEI